LSKQVIYQQGKTKNPNQRHSLFFVLLIILKEEVARVMPVNFFTLIQAVPLLFSEFRN